MKTAPIIPLLLGTALSTLAGEHTIAPGPFELTHTFDATILPENATVYSPFPRRLVRLPHPVRPRSGITREKRRATHHLSIP